MTNVCVMQGRLVEDPELRSTPQGVSVANCRIAVERDHAGKEGKRETDFFTVVAWRGTGEFLKKYFTKGQQILVVGSMQSRRWKDAEGNNRTMYEVMAEKISFCGSKAPGEPAIVPEAEAKTVAWEDLTDLDGDLPF